MDSTLTIISSLSLHLSRIVPAGTQIKFEDIWFRCKLLDIGLDKMSKVC